ncbi:hypothetical protein pdam_00024158, partial [Pocillopora damicornis]|uniref:Uncharacterized protein n=2 Tax=Pocillopora TaxID=46730 RepID=A0AAU9XNK8_9CNID
MLHSFDSRHGAKSVTKAIKKVASGPQRDEGSKWFFELSDKDKMNTMVYTNCEYFSVKSTRTQVYFCMIVQGTLLDVVNHYQGNHVRCRAESR